jgi:hypothetical protein
MDIMNDVQCVDVSLLTIQSSHIVVGNTSSLSHVFTLHDERTYSLSSISVIVCMINYRSDRVKIQQLKNYLFLVNKVNDQFICVS